MTNESEDRNGRFGISFPTVLNRADVPQTVGAMLREARERHGLELEVMANSLRIPRKTLQALEEGDYHTLPPDVYVRGFLRQYGEAVGLDPVLLIRMFTAERARFPHPAPTAPWLHGRPRRGVLWTFLTWRTLAFGGGALGLMVVLGYVLWGVRTYTRPPELLVSEPAADTAIQAEGLLVRGRTDPTAEVFINDDQAFVRDDGTFEHQVHFEEGVHTLQVRARSVGGRETVVTREMLVQSQSGAGSTGGSSSPRPSSGPFTLKVWTEEPTWVSLTVDGTVAFSGIIAPGAEQTVVGEHIVVASDKAEKTHLAVDGEDRGVLDKLPGAVRNALFTRSPQTGTVERQVVSPIPSP